MHDTPAPYPVWEFDHDKPVYERHPPPWAKAAHQWDRNYGWGWQVRDAHDDVVAFVHHEEVADVLVAHSGGEVRPWGT